MSNDDRATCADPVGSAYARLEKEVAREFDENAVRKILAIAKESEDTGLLTLTCCGRLDGAGCADAVVQILEFGYRLERRDSRMGAAFFQRADLAYADLGMDGLSLWVEQGLSLRDVSWAGGPAQAYMEAGATVLGRMGGETFARWIDAGRRHMNISWEFAVPYFETSPAICAQLGERHLFERWIDITERIRDQSPGGLRAFCARGCEVAAKSSLPDLEYWADRGIEISRRNDVVSHAYFSLEHPKSIEVFQSRRRGLALRRIRRTLSLICEALLGRPIHLLSSEILVHDGTGIMESATDGGRLFLPPILDVFGDEESNFLVYKLAAAHEVAHILYESVAPDGKRPLDSADALLRAVLDLVEDTRVDARLFAQLPGLKRDAEGLLRRWKASSDEIAEREAHPLHALASMVWLNEEPPCPTSDLKNVWPRIARIFRSATGPDASREDAVRAAVEIRDMLNDRDGDLLSGYARWPYRGINWPKISAETRERIFKQYPVSTVSTDPEERFDPEEEVNEEARGQFCRRSAKDFGFGNLPTTRNKKKGRGQPNWNLKKNGPEETAPEEAVFHYDEWDYTLTDYKHAWTTVKEMPIQAGSLEFYDDALREHRGMLTLFKRLFERQKPDRIKRLTRQREGEDLDVDAVVEYGVDRRMGITPSDRNYVRRERKQRDVAVLFLIDMSTSTEERIERTGKRIIDIEREGLVLLCEAMASLGDQFGVYGFSSKGRQDIHLYPIKTFDEAHGEDVKRRMGGISGRLATRLGAAVRHCSAILDEVEAKSKLLILLSDGRPGDLDCTDPLYLHEDTRVALNEARRRGIHPFCITVDRDASEYLAAIFGQNRYLIIDDIRTLPERLPAIYMGLTV